MGLFEFLFGKRPKERESYETFKMLNGYVPRFTSYEGSIYESELIRAAINARATHASKLGVSILGTAKPALRTKLQHGPNQLQSWGQFFYRLSTILDCLNTAFLTPIYDQYGEASGIYCPLPERCEIVAHNNVPYLRYKFGWGETAAIELTDCGIMTKFQFKSDFFGSTNHALMPTMDLIHIQDQGIKEGVKNAASYRFYAKVNNFTKAADLKNEARRFSEENFARDGGGVLLFPNTYTDVKQIDAKPWVIDAEQMKAIKESVYSYFGVNEDILQNKAYGDAWTAFYEGAIEPFSIQFSDVSSRMLYTFREQSTGNKILATANRMQYLANREKLNVASQMLDRGVISINDVREMWNLPPVEGGDVRIIRGEYYTTDQKEVD